MSDFRKLLVWQKAHGLALHADRAASAIRTSRHSSLRSQLVRVAMSIPANIAEGRRQESEREFMRFLRYGVNSACELEYHVMAARDFRRSSRNGIANAAQRIDRSKADALRITEHDQEFTGRFTSDKGKFTRIRAVQLSANRWQLPASVLWMPVDEQRKNR
jgi:four helix bundle protein